ncbi:hypothetical protein F2Q70_00021622 [Brassica cretica]|uniref:Uncharacterized protein n=1 Tax=Brassica cretica TaxID=69181 RepID=A0A8S9HIN8_BRACR|nr:hypothetical protein F2Q70_00021622 [Brassica cretica]KAF2556597.1 hypothetical protein F2Q68_00015298 [Brassica cretica]
MESRSGSSRENSPLEDMTIKEKHGGIIRAAREEDKGKEFDDLTDKEMEEPIEKGPTKTLVEKKNGARKKLIKPDALAVGGGAKKRMVQAILSPRKKTAPKGRKEVVEEMKDCRSTVMP